MYQIDKIFMMKKVTCNIKSNIHIISPVMDKLSHFRYSCRKLRLSSILLKNNFMTCLNFSDHFVFLSFFPISIQHASISYRKLADIGNEINSCLMHAHESFEPSEKKTVKSGKFRNLDFFITFHVVILEFNR